jgi:hypothetical protein
MAMLNNQMVNPAKSLVFMAIFHEAWGYLLLLARLATYAGAPRG